MNITQRPAAKYKIQCIKKSDRSNPHDRITHIGFKDLDNSLVIITHAEAIERMENGICQFYIDKDGISIDVFVTTTRFWHKYIKTARDGDQPNNLLDLPDCRQV